MTVSRHAAHYALRTELRAALRADLLGPQGGEDEILATDAPITAYPIGVLFPQSGDAMMPTAGEDDGIDNPPDVVSRDDSEQGSTDLGVALANRRKPSSMGLTFAVDLKIARTVYAAVCVATYVPEDENGLPVEPRRSEARSTGQQDERWRRIAVPCEPEPIDVSVPGMHDAIELRPGLELRTLVRLAASDGTVTVTTTLVNTLRVGEYDLQDAYCFFQPELKISGPEGTRPFVERPTSLGAVDEEQALSRLLHRHAPYFATGHGCSVAWDWEAPAIRTPMPVRAAVPYVRSEFVPTHEVLLTDSNPEIDDAALGMYGLGHSTPDDAVSALSRLLDGYEEWITARTKEAAELDGTDNGQAAEQQIKLCSQALARMRRGVALLADTDRPEIFEAFRLANQAMAQQRARTAWIKDGREGEPDPTSGRWRPFQIAFMLLCLEGIVDPNQGERRVADLLWFPTGGGKTEAYLGLIAFTAFLRRLRDRVNGSGVTVLMRYTLRLLTLQQFERAAALICAMERLRDESADRLGSDPISIGMWVGSSATPNRLDRAQERLDELLKNPDKSLEKENPVQLHGCPWCGERLGAHDYEVRLGTKRMVVRCPNTDCAFHLGEGLPVHLVDEAVYDAHPTLVIATVDKFASMPWRPATAALFNRDAEGDVKPPELIVQDELHLISGPLGTLTGLYETAVDVLADQPKVVASTATIRRASDQVGALFDRKVAQFPPAGLDSRDSWFAVETPREDKASRRYIGLLTPSTSQATLLVRTYAALLDAAARVEADPRVRDAYWTLVGYFNSLRLLSAAELQVLDDVQDRLEMLANRDEAGAAARSATALIELSSRAKSSEIPRHLKQLERMLPDPDVLDVLLATNMISVGVDIDRLGLMAVMGQPQTTAEYIQATSRVGRRHPGLVAVMLNSARSRDRSHYENFPGFHSALYREVESTSVTPFSARARDRGLHAVIVALTRLMIPSAADNKSAAEIEGFVDEINSVVRPCILARVDSVDDEEREATAQHFDEFVKWWQAEAADRPNLVYEAKRNSRMPALLSGFDNIDEESDDTAGWATLWSLRDVDAESTLFHENNR
ncbi:helicase-related protein [Streptomyces europaeiscabiei]|uniref:helicase-related protein n=1 Tax=Streptomyces europaeiscabiei TaxID=146819 RepID=UPI0029A4480B|nr:helicase-related protein [Streptomyces europaeiscabiei]MDX3585634.1 helicase-related protein [Streptomyces europaeiscabiei]